MRSSTTKIGFTTLGLTSVAMLALTGCVGGNGNGGDDGQEITLRLGHIQEPTHPVETCGAPALTEALEGSGLSVEVYGSSQLGSEVEMLEQVTTGSLDMSIAGAGSLGIWHEPIGVLEAGYLFDDVDHFMGTIEGETLQEVFDELASVSGLRAQAGIYYGTRQVTANKEISNPGDMTGVKIRTPDAPIYLKNIGLMGGAATPMAFGEVYLGLQQGVIDAQENPIPTIASANFNEVQDYINITNHMVQGIYVLSQDSLTDSFSDDQKTAFADALQVAAQAITDCIIEEEQEILEGWKADGSITVNEDVDLDAFAQAAQDGFAADPTFGELYTEIRNNR